MIKMSLMTPSDIGFMIAGNLRNYRKSRKISMMRLSELSGVSFGSIRRFEKTGEISLIPLLKIATVLDCADDFMHLFKQPEPKSIKEIIDGQL